MATRSKMKSQYRKENADRRPHATAKHIRISSRKVKIVIDLIRGKSVEDAEAILMYTPKAASEPTLKVLRSAIANAVNNLDMDKETLYVAECFANQGPFAATGPAPAAAHPASASVPAISPSSWTRRNKEDIQWDRKLIRMASE